MPAHAADRDEALHYLALGADAYRMGDIAQATQKWSQAVEFCRLAKDSNLEMEALGRRGEAFEALGHLDSAIEDLTAAVAGARSTGDATRVAILSGALGNAYFHAHLLKEAGPLLEESYGLAKAQATSFLPASANNWGNYLAAEKRDAEAIAAYKDAVSGTDPAQVATALTNRARVLLRVGRAKETTADLARALDLLDAGPQPRGGSLALVAVGRVAMELPAASSGDARRLAYRALVAAQGNGERLKESRLQSMALGYLGELYEHAGRGHEALDLTSRAIFLAQGTSVDNDLLYRWQWQRGRLLRANGDLPGALGAFREAVANLASVRQDIPIEYNNGRSSFRETSGPLFFDLADLLLRQARVTISADGRRKLLREAQQTVESLKTAEVKDYFHDACLDLPQSGSTFTARLELHTAALYPIVLPDRLELLLSLPDDIVQVTVPIDQEHLTLQVRLFRALAEKRMTDEYLVPARRLYDLIIRPVEDQLAKAQIDTLVFVPDGPLRTIPLGALYDGRHYMVERYALATAPGLSLVEPKLAAPVAGEQALLAGLTVKIGEFPALPQVAAELATIGHEVRGDILKDADFKTEAVKQRLQQAPYGILHIASHGVFKGDSANSYLVAYDGHLKLDDLAQDLRITSLRDHPISLLTLSACQTAAGDDRAALGLAGVAIKAGAETAIATLWLINDAAAAEIMPNFYRALQMPGISKAKAMQKAQVAMLADSRYAHPSYWAAFLVIGNWQ